MLKAHSEVHLCLFSSKRQTRHEAEHLTSGMIHDNHAGHAVLNQFTQQAPISQDFLTQLCSFYTKVSLFVESEREIHRLKWMMSHWTVDSQLWNTRAFHSKHTRIQYSNTMLEFHTLNHARIHADSRPIPFALIKTHRNLKSIPTNRSPVKFVRTLSNVFNPACFAPLTTGLSLLCFLKFEIRGEKF